MRSDDNIDTILHLVSQPVYNQKINRDAALLRSIWKIERYGPSRLRIVFDELLSFKTTT